MSQETSNADVARTFKARLSRAGHGHSCLHTAAAREPFGQGYTCHRPTSHHARKQVARSVGTLAALGVGKPHSCGRRSEPSKESTRVQKKKKQTKTNKAVTVTTKQPQSHPPVALLSKFTKLNSFGRLASARGTCRTTPDATVRRDRFSDGEDTMNRQVQHFTAQTPRALHHHHNVRRSLAHTWVHHDTCKLRILCTLDA